MKPWRMLALGDSYTIGEGVAEHERWPMQLAARLRSRGVAAQPPQIIAQTGWSSDELLAALRAQAASLQPPYDLVSLAVGVNNQYRGWPVEDYRRDLGQLLELALRWAGNPARVRMLSIPDWGVTPFAQAQGRVAAEVAAGIDAFNAAAAGCCAALGVRMVDVTAISRATAGQPEALVADGLHPSAQAYAAWAEAVLESF